MVFYEFALPIYNTIPFLIAFFALLIGSYTDLRTREVPDWLNFGLIGTGFGVNLLLSIIFWKIDFIVNSIIGFGVFFAIAWIMFYTGQWGGGDSKMLMGLGALIGIDVFSGNFPFILSFVINILLIGALYGILWSVILVIKNKKRFIKAFNKNIRSKKIIRTKKIIFIIFAVMLLLALIVQEYFARLMFLYIALIVVITFYLWIAVKAVENSCMLKLVNPKHLTEGDWIAKDIKVKGKYIAGPKDLGIEKKQINKLIVLYKKKKVKKVLIKEGIPFVPSFLIAFIVTLMLGNLVFLFY